MIMATERWTNHRGEMIMAEIEKTALVALQNDSSVSDIESKGYDIKSMIYVVRNQQVMIDNDLAMLYQVETGRLNEAVKRNISLFPKRFRFQLTKEEYLNLKPQSAISSLNRNGNTYGGRRTLPYAFTEQGIAMLSTVLRSEIAIQTSIRIMDTFVEMRRFPLQCTYFLLQISNSLHHGFKRRNLSIEHISHDRVILPQRTMASWSPVFAAVL